MQLVHLSGTFLNLLMPLILSLTVLCNANTPSSLVYPHILAAMSEAPVAGCCRHIVGSCSAAGAGEIEEGGWNISRTALIPHA